MNRTIVISRNTAWSLYNFHANLIKAMLDEGYDVVAVAPGDSYNERLRSCGCQLIEVPMDNHGTNPARDVLLLLRYVQLLRHIRPFIYLGYTIKPNVYGSLAANALGIPVVNNISGLGVTFLKNNMLTQVVRNLYKLGLRRSRRIFFQNEEDQRLFVQNGLARIDVTDRLPGSGIDLSRYCPAPCPLPLKRPFRFLLVARMIKHKGIVDFVKAARIVRCHFPDTEFRLVGFLNPKDPNGITAEEMRSWQEEGMIEYCGETDDVRPYLVHSDCIVLPSGYPEGVPRSLLEAAAVARPIITTDTAGCRDIVTNDVNGFHCRVRDAEDLAEKMLRMLLLPAAVRTEMGNAGRRKVEAEFDEKIVIKKYLDVIGNLHSQHSQDHIRIEEQGAGLAGLGSGKAGPHTPG